MTGCIERAAESFVGFFCIFRNEFTRNPGAPQKTVRTAEQVNKVAQSPDFSESRYNP